jgi:hypothetical protein
MTGFFFIFLGIGAIALFSFLSVATFSDNRRKERIEYYRHETLKKLAEQPAEQSEPVLEALRVEEQIRHRKGLEGIKLTGLIMTTIGLGLGIFLYAIVPDEAVALVGLIPLAIGVAFLVYGTMMAPAPDELIPPRRKE